MRVINASHKFISRICIRVSICILSLYAHSPDTNTENTKKRLITFGSLCMYVYIFIFLFVGGPTDMYLMKR